MVASVARKEKTRSPWIANEKWRRLDHHFLVVFPQFLGGVGQKASGRDMKILFLHGWNSVPGGVKPSYLKSHGHTVINPKLDDEDFDESVRVAQAEFDQHQPDVVVGSSRGGAVAMNIDSGDTPLVLLCPAWKRWGSAKTAKKNTTILHSRADDVVPFEDSVELVRNSGLPESALIQVGNDHRLADPEPLAKMLEACESPEGG